MNLIDTATDTAAALADTTSTIAASVAADAADLAGDVADVAVAAATAGAVWRRRNLVILALLAFGAFAIWKKYRSSSSSDTTGSAHRSTATDAEMRRAS